MTVLIALLPVMTALLGPLSIQAGRLSWLAPVCALPGGALLCWIWKSSGGRSLPQTLEEALGRRLGKGLELIYLLWGLWLTLAGARRYVGRTLTLASGERTGWLCLAAALALAVWLCRGEGRVLVRVGRLFFGAVAAALLLALALSLPALEWRNLWPPTGGDLAGLGLGALTAASLSGWGIFGLCLPGEREERPGGWMLLGCGTLAGLTLITLGTFGPALTGRMEEPFLLLLEGAAAPGAFRRGEAALAAVLTLSDLTLLSVLLRGCSCLWRELFSGRWEHGVWFLAGAAFWRAGQAPAAPENREGLLLGGLLLGLGVPALALLTERAKKARRKGATSCGEKSG